MRSPPKRSVVYPLVCISFSRYSPIFSLSTPTPIERSPSILIPPPVLPSLASCDRFLGSCLLPVPLPRYSPSSLPPPSAFLFRSAHPHHSAPYLCQRRRCHRYSDARTRTATRIFSAWECVRIGRANARSHPHEGELLRTMRYVHARARTILPSFEPGCTVPVRCNGELRKGGGGGGGELTRFHACLSFGYSGVISIALLKMCILKLHLFARWEGRHFLLSALSRDLKFRDYCSGYYIIICL